MSEEGVCCDQYVQEVMLPYGGRRACPLIKLAAGRCKSLTGTPEWIAVTLILTTIKMHVH